MTSEEKIANVNAQLDAIIEERTNVLHCPYCETNNQQGEELCCMTLAKAIEAILDRKHVHDLAQLAARIADRLN